MCTDHVHDLNESEAEVDDHRLVRFVDWTDAVVIVTEDLPQQPLFVRYSDEVRMRTRRMCILVGRRRQAENEVEDRC